MPTQADPEQPVRLKILQVGRIIILPTVSVVQMQSKTLNHYGINTMRDLEAIADGVTKNLNHREDLIREGWPECDLLTVEEAIERDWGDEWAISSIALIDSGSGEQWQITKEGDRWQLKTP